MRAPGRCVVLASLALALAALAAACTTPLTPGGDDGTAHGDDDDDGPTTTPPGPMVAFAPSESNADLVNPERGYYTGYKLAEAGDADRIRTDGFALAISIVNLDAYTSSALPASFLAKLDEGFARARHAGIKLVVRFTYDDVGGADAPKARILGHLDQLAPVLADNADVIAAVQAGLIGKWGEWHSSANGLDNEAARREIIDGLLEAVPASRSVQLRKPTFKNAYTAGAIAATEAFTDSARARLGHHNDCFLASNTDLGTYDPPVETWKSYLTADSQYTPMGGETCAVFPVRTSCSVALAELAQFHWTYLNRKYNLDVITSWIAGGCEDEISRSLGYRFALTQVAHSERVAPGGVLGLELDIANRGFAVPMNARPVEVVLTSGAVRKVARLTLDARHFTAGATTAVRASLRIPADLAAGTYSLALRLPDAAPTLAADPRYAIQLANDGLWNAATGDNLLTDALVIDAAAPGSVDASATAFVQL